MEVMEEKVKPGFKKTEVGLIPEDWIISDLQSITSKIGDGIHSTPRYSSGGSYFFINGNNLVNGNIKIYNETKTVEASEYKLHKRELSENTLLLSINGTIGNVAHYNGEPVVIGKSAAYININKSAEKRFVFYILQSKFVQDYFEDELTGTTIKNLGIGAIRKTPIPLPPTLVEQKAIANALSDIDEQICRLENLIKKKKTIKQGTMQLLLTPSHKGGKRLPGFEGEWEEKRLGDVCSQINDGTHHTPDYKDQGIPFYSVENVSADDFNNVKFISKNEHEKLIKRCKPEKGDILLTRIGTLGITKLIDWNINASIYVSLALLKPNESIDSQYLYVYTKLTDFYKMWKEDHLQMQLPKKSIWVILQMFQYQFRRIGMNN